MAFITETTTKAKIENALRKPSRYHVVMHNDDVTPFDFVIQILMEHFQKSLEEAQALAMSVHKTGRGICGTYSYDIATTKADHVVRIARNHNFPLVCMSDKE